MKYTGSKARISKDISSIINELIKTHDIKTYIEPFCGGCNVIDRIECENKIASDNNEYLIELWKSIKCGYNFPEFITRDEWYKVKYNKDDFNKDYVGLVGVLASYNGCWFTSYGGSANTKSGKVRNYYQEAVNNVKKQIPKIQDVEFKCGDYTQFSDVKGCLIYCDPPYSKGKHRYKESNNFDSHRFWEWCRMVSKNNIVLISEYESESDFIIIYEKQLAKTHPDQVNKSPTEKIFTVNRLLDEVRD